MDLIKSVKLRTAAKSIADVEIPDASWKPDFDIADRYQNFANELMRIALLGIAAYGFLIKEAYMKDPVHYPMSKEIANYLCLGSIALCISLILVLIHRFFSTACLYHQILIMRSLKRLENPHWTIEEKEQEKNFLAQARKYQMDKSRASYFILISASIFFALGFLFIIIIFYKFFYTLSI